MKKCNVPVLLLCFVFLTGLILWPVINRKSANFLGTGIGGHFVLNSDGGKFNTKSADADFFLVYFGFTFCPDVCPTELARLATVKDGLGPLAKRIKFLFITLDPERDEVKKISEYARAFDDDFIGLTGTEEEIKIVAKQFGIFFERIEGDDKDDYTIDHTSRIFLLNSESHVVKLFSFGSSEEEMIREIKNKL